MTTNEDTAYTFSADDFNFADTDTADTLSSVTIVTLPASNKGTLKLDNTAVTAEQSVSNAPVSDTGPEPVPALPVGGAVVLGLLLLGLMRRGGGRGEAGQEGEVVAGPRGRHARQRRGAVGARAGDRASLQLLTIPSLEQWRPPARCAQARRGKGRPTRFVPRRRLPAPVERRAEFAWRLTSRVSMRPTRALFARDMQPGGLAVNDYPPHPGRWGRVVGTRPRIARPVQAGTRAGTTWRDNVMDDSTKSLAAGARGELAWTSGGSWLLER